MVVASKTENTTDKSETENNKTFQNINSFSNIKCYVSKIKKFPFKTKIQPHSYTNRNFTFTYVLDELKFN
jgi:hypothetical protein